MLMTANILSATFDRGLAFDRLVALGKADGHDRQWHERYGRLGLDPDQAALVRDFKRDMKVLCMTGTWCGDCALQGAAMQRIAEASPEHIDLRFIPRSEEFAELITPNTINAGFRVPLTWFMADDFEPVSRIGDRTLSRYRSIAVKALGAASGVLAPPPVDPVREVLREVLGEFERVQLLLRLSTRMRERYGD